MRCKYKTFFKRSSSVCIPNPKPNAFIWANFSKIELFILVLEVIVTFRTSLPVRISYLFSGWNLCFSGLCQLLPLHFLIFWAERKGPRPIFHHLRCITSPPYSVSLFKPHQGYPEYLWKSFWPAQRVPIIRYLFKYNEIVHVRSDL